MEPLVRFDDRRHTRAGVVFRGLSEVIETRDLDEVVSCLGDVEQAVSRGRWAAGYIAYDAAPAFDPGMVVPPRRTAAEAALPLLWFGLFEERLHAGEVEAGAYRAGEWRTGIGGEDYQRAFERIQEHLARGDTYQVNLTYPLSAPFEGDPAGLYGDLIAAQSAAYCAYLDTGRFQILGASPELFFSRRGDRIVCKPMKGTAPRGRWAEEDDESVARLVGSAKERAENVMIVDLIRNDLGKIARFGSVRVERLFEPERYETVWQLTSTVSAVLRPNTSAVAVFGALFPCGSVTGAPKQRTMEIISDLEGDARGVYCGAIGFLAPPGTGPPDAEFSVAIRTAVIDRASGIGRYGVGGGITVDSRPGAELAETVMKARILSGERPQFDLVETLRWERRGGYWWPERHLERLERSARYFGFLFDHSLAEKQLAAAAGEAARTPLRVRLTLSRDGTLRTAIEPLTAEHDSVRLALDDAAVDPSDPLLYHKTTHRARYEEARARHPEADDVLLVNQRGEVTESTIANLIVMLDGAWVTPPLASGCLPGIYRQVLLEAGMIEERAITVADLRRAERISLVNSVRLIRPARLT